MRELSIVEINHIYGGKDASKVTTILLGALGILMLTEFLATYAINGVYAIGFTIAAIGTLWLCS